MNFSQQKKVDKRVTSKAIKKEEPRKTLVLNGRSKERSAGPSRGAGATSKSQKSLLHKISQQKQQIAQLRKLKLKSKGLGKKSKQKLSGHASGKKSKGSQKPAKVVDPDVRAEELDRELEGYWVKGGHTEIGKCSL